MTRAEFEAKWAGKHPTSWDDPAADEWLQDEASIEDHADHTTRQETEDAQHAARYNRP